MSGTKILVLHIKEIIRGITFIFFGLTLIFTIIYFLFSQNQNVAPENPSTYSPPEDEHSVHTSVHTFVPGTYFAEIPLNTSPAGVEVTVTENEIVNIALTDLSDAHQTFYPLLTPTMYTLAQEIIESQSLDVTVSSENSVTSGLLVNAISKALGEASVQ